MPIQRLLILLTAVFLMPVSSARAELRVWTETATRRVLREEAPGSGLEVRIALARNEWRSFQILVRSDQPVKTLTVVPGDLVGPAGAKLTPSSARLFRQHQMHITVGTTRNDTFRPSWYPDGLVPFSHPLTGRPLPDATLAAVPFDLPADETHGFWVDLFAPPGTRPGVYRGVYGLEIGGGRAASIPVELTVWDFELPATPTMRTAFGAPDGRLKAWYAERAKAGREKMPDDWAAVENQCWRLLAEHRVNATPPGEITRPVRQRDGSWLIPSAQVDRLREFVDRWHVNAVAAPRPASVFADPEKDRAGIEAWLKCLDRAAKELDRPGVLFYIYLIDEPNDAEAYARVRSWGKAIRATGTAVKVMVTEQTQTQDPAWGDLYGAVDVWCPLMPLFVPDSAAKRQALGESIWVYTALCQRTKTPWWHIDYPLLHYRVPAWIAWRYRIRGLLYWGGMSYWKQVDDPWNEPWTYGHGKEGARGRAYNGEGTLVYPASAAGYDGIAPSIRLKALRDAIEDYDYLALLEGLGRSNEARGLVEPLVESWFKWETDPTAYDRARERLAALILNARTRP
ncbi:MAG TPA: DUF4091 domain-containing protein [Planctomycetota bacterium]|nr:DUF4091 domain-containing protein [Planctomycetota bacterium]